MKPEHAAGYLAGMIDGEGCVSNYGGTQRRIRVFNTDRALIDATLEACAVLGIAARVLELNTPSRRAKAWSPTWEVAITGRLNLERVAEVVPLRSPTKLATLKSMVLTYQRERRTPADVAWARELHAVGMGYTRISRALRIPRSTIQGWLSKQGSA